MLEEVTESIEELKAQDITHDDLGIANGWHDAQATKNKAVEHVEGIVNLITEHGTSVQDGFLNENLTKINQQLAKLKSQAASVATTVQKGTNQTNYPQQRTNITNQIATTYETLQKETFPLESALKVARLESQLSSGDALKDIEASADSSLQQLNLSNEEAEKIIQSLRNNLAELGVEKASSNFSTLAAEHKTQESFWFKAFIGASIATVLAILWAVLSFKPETEITKVLVEFIKRAFIVSTPAVFMRVALSKYNLERNLKILYNHRDTVLEQYNIFEGAIGDEDVEAKNQFRLEIAKIIFSDPSTGYTGSISGNELNLSLIHI